MFKVIVESDSDCPENNGEVVFITSTYEEAKAFIAGAAFVNDSALLLTSLPCLVPSVANPETLRSENAQKKDHKHP